MSVLGEIVNKKAHKHDHITPTASVVLATVEDITSRAHTDIWIDERVCASPGATTALPRLEEGHSQKSQIMKQTAENNYLLEKT